MTDLTLPQVLKPVHRRRLRNLLLNPKVQLRFVLWPLFGVMGLLLIYLSFVIMHCSALYDLIQLQIPESALAVANLKHQLVVTVLGFLGASALFLVFICLMLLIFTHRLVGPWIQFSRAFARFGGGELGVRIHLRKDDLMHDLANEFNQMAKQADDNWKRK